MLRGLIAETVPRATAADWAARWVIADDPNVPDRSSWTAIVRLSGADLISTDRPYLHDKADFCQWLADFLDLSPT